MTEPVVVSILTTLYNDQATIAESLEATCAQQTTIPFEVLVLDDGSTDQSAEIVKRFAQKDDRIHLISMPHKGQAHAINAGVRLARGKFIALIESDVAVSSDWLEKLMPQFDAHDVYDAGGYLMTPPEDPWIARLGGYELEYRFSQRDRIVNHLTAADVIYRREAFDQTGGFDTDLPHSCPDVEFNLRLHNQNKKLVFEKDCTAWHHFKSSLSGYLKRQYAYGVCRPFLSDAKLYNRDNSIIIQVLLTVALVCCLPLLYWSTWPFLLTLTSLLLVTLPVVLELYKRKKDPALFLLGPLLILRNFFGLVGLAHGLYKKHITGVSSQIPKGASVE